MAHEVVVAVQDILERDGVLQTMRAKLRATISHLLLHSNPDDQVKTSNNIHNFIEEYEYGKLSLEIVRDMLSSLGLVETLTVFDAECGLKSMDMSKDALGKALNINVSSIYGVNKPVLVEILGKYKRPNKLDQLSISTHSVDSDKHPILATSPKNRAPSPVSNRSPSPLNLRSNSPVTFNNSHDDDHIPSIMERRPNTLTPINNHSPIEGNSPTAASGRANSFKQLSVDTTSPVIDNIISSPNSSSGSVNILKKSPTNSVVSPGNKLSPSSSSSSSNRSPSTFTFRSEEKSSPPTASSASSLSSTKNLPPLGRPKSGKLEPISGISSVAPSKFDHKESVRNELDLSNPHNADVNNPALSALEDSIEEVPENDSSQESSPEKSSANNTSGKIYSLGRVSAHESGASNSRILKVKESVNTNIVEQRAGVNVLKSTGGGVSRRQTGWNVDSRDDDNDDFVFTETVDNNNEYKSSASIHSRSPVSPPIATITRTDQRPVAQSHRNNLDASDDLLSTSYRSNQEDEDDYASPASKGSKASPVVTKVSQGFMVATNAPVNKSLTSNKSDNEYGDDFEEDDEISEELDESIYEDDEASGSNDSDEPVQSLTKTKSGNVSTTNQITGWANTTSNTFPKKSSVVDSKMDMEDLEELSVASNDSDRYEFSVGKSADSGGNDSFSFLSNSPNRNATTRRVGNRSESDRSNDFSTHEYEVSDDHDSQYDFSAVAKKR